MFNQLTQDTLGDDGSPLDRMVNEFGMESILDALAHICERSEHNVRNMQTTNPLAASWSSTGKILAQLAAYLRSTLKR